MVCSSRGDIPPPLVKPMPHITSWDALRVSFSTWDGLPKAKRAWHKTTNFTAGTHFQDVEQSALTRIVAPIDITTNVVPSAAEDNFLVDSGVQDDVTGGLKGQAFLTEHFGFTADNYSSKGGLGKLNQRAGHFEPAADMIGSLGRGNILFGNIRGFNQQSGDGFEIDKTEDLISKSKGLDSSPGGNSDQDNDNNGLGCHRNYFGDEKGSVERFNREFDENYDFSNDDDSLDNDPFPFPGSSGDADSPEPAAEDNGGEGGMTDPDHPMSVDPAPSEDDSEAEDDSQGGMSDPDHPMSDEPASSDDVDQSSDSPMNDHQGAGGGAPAVDDPSSDINWGPDVQNGASGGSSLDGLIDQLDPITNWGPNGNADDARLERSLCIANLDPRTNWGDAKSDAYAVSGFFEVLGGIEPRCNEFNNHHSNQFELVTTVSSDFI